jgi:hypothetical protein
MRMTTENEREPRTVRADGFAEPASGPEQPREEIDPTRTDLAKTDVKAKAEAKLAEKREDATAKIAEKRQQATAKVAEVQEKVVGSLPPPARQSLDRVQQQARARPVPAAFLGGLATGWLIGRRKKKKK